MYFRKIFILSYLILFLNCETVQKKENPPIVKKKTTALYTDLDGNPIKINDFKGKRVVLNFWATWCTSCVKEMPSMEKAQEVLSDENYVFLFATTQKLKKIQTFKKRHPHPFQFLQYHSSLDKLTIYALPATLIYNTQGDLVKRIDGATEWDSEEMLTILRAIP